MSFLSTVVLSVCVLAGADTDDKPTFTPDVVVKSDDKTGTAKPGQLVEFQVQHAVAPPFPSDFTLKVNGKAMKAVVLPSAVKGPKGETVIGVGNNSTYFTFETAGKRTVVIGWKSGDKMMTKEISLEVK